MLTVLLALLTATAFDLSTIAEALASREHRLASGVPLIPLSAYEEALSGRTVARLSRVEGVSAAKAWGVAVIDAPVEQVWMAINNDSALAEYLPVSQSTVIAGDTYGAPRRVFELMPLPLISDRWWMVDVQHNPALYTATHGLA